MRLAAILTVILCLNVAGCASRPGPEVLDTVREDAPTARTVTLYVATTRTRKTAAENVFTRKRAKKPNFARFVVSIPPNHKPAQIEWPKGKPDPKTTFAVVSQSVLTEAEFRADMEREVKAGRPDLLLYVHGYNNNFQESLFRLAQLTADSGTPGTAVLFSWPSQASLAGYVADKDSVTYSRDDLVTVLDDMTRVRNARRITVFAHSMGGMLTMEALRQLRLSGDRSTFNRLSQVILAAPDIDIDVFRKQMKVIGPDHPPMIVLVSPDDRALLISRRLSHSKSRVGTLDVTDPQVEAIAKANRIQIIDISEITPTDATRHDRFVELAGMVPQLSASEKRRSGNPIGHAGAFVLDTVGATISAPFRIGSQVLSN